MGTEVNKEYLGGIWTRFKSGDQEAFAVLYNLHIDKLFSYGTKFCRDEEAIKDALQELFLELFLKRDKIKIVPENLRFYLMLALKRNLIKKLQSGRRIIQELDESANFMAEYSIELQVIEKEKDAEINRKVLNALNQLPPKQKEAIYLRFNESLEYSEIAEILEITIESVRKQVYRALKTVREIIGDEFVAVYFSFIVKKC